MGLVVFGIELGVRPSSLKELTLCCWQPRPDGSVGVQVDLMKNGKNGVVFCPVLDRAEGHFEQNCSAVSFFEEFLRPFITVYGASFDPRLCTKKVASSLVADKLYRALVNASVETADGALPKLANRSTSDFVSGGRSEG